MRRRAEPLSCTNLKLRQVDRLVTRHYDAYIVATGLKTTQYSLLSHVVSRGPIRPSDLAQRMGLEASTLTRNLQPLVAQGWVRQGPGEDARSRLVQATQKGRAKRNEAKRAWKRAQIDVNQRLGLKTVVALHALLETVMGRLREVNDDRPANE